MDENTKAMMGKSINSSEFIPFLHYPPLVLLKQ